MRFTAIGVIPAATLILMGASGMAAPTITACYSNATGNVRIVSTPSACRPSESSVTWNVAGPTGPAGPQGPVGPPGPAGPSGTSLAWINIPSDSVVLSTSYATIASVTVPAGTYVIFGKAFLSNSDAVGDHAVCKLSTGDFTEVDLEASGTADEMQANLQDGATFYATTQITMACEGYGVLALEPVLTAVAVDQLTSQ